MELHFAFAIAALIVGFALAWLLGGKSRKALVAANEFNAARTRELEDLGAKHDDALERIESLEGDKGELANTLQQSRIQVTELERRVHDSKMWEVKYEKLLKENAAHVESLSDFQKTKVELTFTQQKLAAAKKRVEELEGVESGSESESKDSESTDSNSEEAAPWLPSKIV